MDSTYLLNQRVRALFPQISASADRCNNGKWEGTNSLWFECLAQAINEDIVKEVPYSTHRRLFEFMDGAYAQGDEDVRSCVDSSFVENLFWQIASVKCAPYWAALPPRLRRLYVAFHGFEP